MSFVSLPPVHPPADEIGIINDGFFPDIDPASVRDAARVPPSITPSRLRAAILGAVLTVHADLEAYRQEQRDAGHATLADVPAPQLDGQSIQVIRYNRAIALYAKAELVERHRDFDTTQAGSRDSGALDESVSDLRRDAQHAVRDITARGRTCVDLI